MSKFCACVGALLLLVGVMFLTGCENKTIYTTDVGNSEQVTEHTQNTN